MGIEFVHAPLFPLTELDVDLVVLACGLELHLRDANLGPVAEYFEPCGQLLYSDRLLHTNITLSICAEVAGIGHVAAPDLELDLCLELLLAFEVYLAVFDVGVMSEPGHGSFDDAGCDLHVQSSELNLLLGVWVADVPQQPEIEVRESEGIGAVAVMELVHLLPVKLWPEILAYELDLLLRLHGLVVSAVQELLYHAFRQDFDVAASQLAPQLSARLVFLQQRLGVVFEDEVQIRVYEIRIRALLHLDAVGACYRWQCHRCPDGARELHLIHFERNCAASK